MLSIYDVSLNIRGKDSNNLLISQLASVVVCIFSYVYFFRFGISSKNEIFPSIILVCSQMLRVVRCSNLKIQTNHHWHCHSL